MANVLQLLEKINRTAQRINNPGLGKLEYDLLMQHVRDLYDELDTLRNGKPIIAEPASTKQVEQLTTTEHIQPEELILHKPIVQESIVMNDTTETVVSVSKANEDIRCDVVYQPVVKHEQPIIEFINEPAVEIKYEPLQQPIKQEPVAVLEEQAVVSHTPITDKVEQTVPINERIKGSTDLNERWRGATTEVHQRFAMKPMKDMIDLNRRIAFVNELFKGNAEELNKAIQTIDAATDYEVAKAYVNSLARTWNWYESSQSAKLFVKLVKQRFGME